MIERFGPEGHTNSDCTIEHGDKFNGDVVHVVEFDKGRYEKKTRQVPKIAPSWNAPRNANWASEGKWVHWAKLAFGWHFLRKICKDVIGPWYEKTAMRTMKINKIQSR